MTDHERTVKALHDLIATSNDAAEGFAKAAKGVHDTELSDWLAAASNQRESFSADLTKELKNMGEEPRLDLHVGGILHKGWVDLEQRLRSTAPHLHSKDDKEIIRECIAGESGSLTHFDHALTQNLNEDTRLLVIQQRTTVDDDLTYLQSRVNRGEAHSA
ncbi:MAG: PA2169 family four-helix-bundle protein [Bryobacteraceae bacterium]